MKSKKVGEFTPSLRITPMRGGVYAKDEWKFALKVDKEIKYMNRYVGSTFIISRLDVKRLKNSKHKYNIYIMPLPKSDPWSGVYKSVMRIDDEIKFIKKSDKHANKKPTRKRKNPKQ